MRVTGVVLSIRLYVSLLPSALPTKAHMPCPHPYRLGSNVGQSFAIQTWVKPHRLKSSNDTTSALMNPRSKSVWMTPAA